MQEKITSLFSLSNYFLNFYAIPNFIVSLAIFILGVFILSKGTRKETNVYFGFCAFSTSIWIFFAALAYMCRNETVAFFWARFSYIGVTFISASIYAFSVAYLGLRNQRKFVIAAFILSGCFCVISQTSWMIRAVREYFWGYYSLANSLHPYFLALFFILMLASLINFYKGYKQETLSIEKERRRLLCLAFFVAYCGSVDYLPNYGIEFYPFGYLPVFVLFPVLVYAIIKHRLMDIETIIHKIVIYTLLSMMILLIYGGMMLLVHVLLGSGNVNIRQFIFSSLFLLCILFFLSYLKDKTQAFVDRLFYKDKYDYRKTLSKFVEELSFHMDSPVLLETIANSIADIMHVDRVALFLFDEKTDNYVVRKYKGSVDSSIKLRKDDPFAVFLNSYGNIVERELFMAESYFKDARVEGVDFMKALDAELIIPLIVQHGLIGILAIGKKLSGDAYKIEDIELLSTVGQEIAVSISNYLLYEGLEKSNYELREAQTQLVQSAKMAAVGQLGAGVAHELNNPLGGILGYAQFILDKMNRPDFGPNDFQSCKKYIESIERESDRCKKIVSNLLKFSRRQPIDKFESLDVGAALQETLTIMSYQLQLRNVSVSSKLKSDLVPVIGVVNLLQQVFTNFILNAQQAMPSGGQLSITAENILDYKTMKPAWVKIEFSDTGCGISEENLNRIFEPFFTTKTEKGTGLGLSISYQIIQEHKGKVEVKSEVGKGTTFTVFLPAAQGD